MEHQKTNHHHPSHQHAGLIQILLDCALACEICATASLGEKDVTPMAHCIEVDRDCAELCTTAAKLLMRDSEFAHALLAVCEKACRHCAEECNKHQHEHCKKCAAEASRCADACHAHHGKIELK